jgi:hypothetical protein
MQAGGLFRQLSAGEHHCANPASSIPRAYGRDQMYLQSVRICYISSIPFDPVVVDACNLRVRWDGRQI